jgi:predicted nucleic acid-binding protein
MIVIADASPLLALAQADVLWVLRALFGQVLVPAAVRRETVDNCPVPDQRGRIERALGDYLVVQMVLRLRDVGIFLPQPAAARH